MLTSCTDTSPTRPGHGENQDTVYTVYATFKSEKNHTELTKTEKNPMGFASQSHPRGWRCDGSRRNIFFLSDVARGLKRYALKHKAMRNKKRCIKDNMQTQNLAELNVIRRARQHGKDRKTQPRSQIVGSRRPGARGTGPGAWGNTPSIVSWLSQKCV